MRVCLLLEEKYQTREMCRPHTLRVSTLKNNHLAKQPRDKEKYLQV